MVRDHDRAQHIALARTRARKKGANVQASVRNAATDYDRTMKAQRKKDRKTKRLDDLLNEPSVPSFLDRLEIVEQVEALLSKLDERDRASLTLFHLLQLSRTEVGDALGINNCEVTHLLQRARAKAREVGKTMEVCPVPATFCE